MFPMGTKAFSSFAYFGGFFLFPLLMEQVYGYSVSQVGFISVARPLLFAISAPIAGYMTVRTGERTATLFGAGSLFVSMILFATLSPSAGLFIILVALALSGLGMGVSMPATSATMSNELAASEYGVMSAAQLLATQVGEVAGIQAVLTIQESIARRSGLGNVHHSPALLHSFAVPFWVCAGVAAGAVFCGLFIRSLPRDARAAQQLAGYGLTGRIGYSVMSRSLAAISAALGSPAAGAAWRAISLAMSPSTRTLPAMKACMPAWGLPSMRMALAVS